MPNIKSVKKDVKKSRQNHLRNSAAKSAVKTFIKKAKQVIETGAPDAIQESLKQTLSVIDKTAERGIIHPNAAARRKSRLMKRANLALAAATNTAAPAAAQVIETPSEPKKRTIRRKKTEPGTTA